MQWNIKNDISKERLACFGACAVVYLFLDIPFRAMGFLNLLPLAGPKNALPMVAGLVFGPAGIGGTAVGALLSNLLYGGSGMEAVSEALAAAAASALFHLLWYLQPKGAVKTDLKTIRHMIRFFLTGTAAGFVMGGVEGLLLSRSFETGFSTLFLEVGISSSAWLLLIGMPVFILLTSVFAIQPWAPGRMFGDGEKKDASDLVLEIGSNVQELAVVGDAVEQYNEISGIPARRGYAIMSCVEELSVLLQKQLPATGKIHIHISSASNVVIRLRYPGARYNPFSVQVAPGGPGANLDILGILMVREMAVHVRYRRRQEENELTIVV